MTLKAADRILRKWQKRLKLQDWDIRLTFKANLSPDVWGQCQTWKNKYIAEIEVALPEMLAKDSEAPSMDELIVHELLHIVFVYHELGIEIGDNPIHKHYERGVDKLAKVLVEMGNVYWLSKERME